MPHDLPSTESAIDAFIHAFESGTLDKSRWTHAAHILTGACYVHSFGEPAASGSHPTSVPSSKLELSAHS